jgi:F0F1-type ATP synthase assembly protein I
MSDQNKEKPMAKYARFSGLGIQMGVIIGFFSWLGVYLDDKYKTKTPWWTIGLSLFGVTAALYLIIREVVKLSKDKDEE